MSLTLTKTPKDLTPLRGQHLMPPHADALTVLDRGLDLLAAALRETSASARAASVAGALRALAPEGVLFACRLTGDGESVAHVVDRAGAAQPDAVLEGGVAGTVEHGRRWLVRELESAARVRISGTGQREINRILRTAPRHAIPVPGMTSKS